MFQVLARSLIRIGKGPIGRQTPFRTYYTEPCKPKKNLFEWVKPDKNLQTPEQINIYKRNLQRLNHRLISDETVIPFTEDVKAEIKFYKTKLLS